MIVGFKTTIVVMRDEIFSKKKNNFLVISSKQLQAMEWLRLSPHALIQAFQMQFHYHLKSKLDHYI